METRFKWTTITFMATLALAVQPSAFASSTYTFYDLGFDGLPQDINDSGQVVGFTIVGSGYYHAFLWDAENGMQDLTLGGNNSRAFGINNSGQVVGEMNDDAVLWNSVAEVQLLVPYGNYNCARAINDSGQVVGYSRDSSGHYEAFLWDDGTVDGLGTLGGTSSHAYDINDSGQVVGESGNSNGRHEAFLWDPDTGTMDGLGTFESGSYYPSSSARAINDGGQVVGYSNSRAILWDDGTMDGLRTLGGYGSSARDINDAGQVVGYSGNAFLWDTLNGMQDLNELDNIHGADWSEHWTMREACAINSYGDIVGIAQYDNGVDAPYYHAFLLEAPNPVPEPATVSLVGMGLGSLVLLRLRRKRS